MGSTKNARRKKQQHIIPEEYTAKGRCTSARNATRSSFDTTNTDITWLWNMQVTATYMILYPMKTVFACLQTEAGLCQSVSQRWRKFALFCCLCRNLRLWVPHLRQRLLQSIHPHPTHKQETQTSKKTSHNQLDSDRATFVAFWSQQCFVFFRGRPALSGSVPCVKRCSATKDCSRHICVRTLVGGLFWQSSRLHAKWAFIRCPWMW